VGRQVEGRAVAARRLPESGPYAGAHILLLGPRREASLREAVAAATGPAVVVTEQPGALAAGSVINFSTQAGRVRFSVSLAAAESRNIKLSARLLAVAQAVEGRVP